MIKSCILAIVAIFISWSILDFVIHGLLLESTYHATAQFWRGPEQMKMELMSLVNLIFISAFVFIYSALINPKNLVTGLKYGLIFGIGIGTSMGFGTYSYMPIPLHLAITWMLGTLVQTSVSGLIVGALVKDKSTA